jgi:uncharacterized protein YjiS (DUF1127 family)
MTGQAPTFPASRPAARHHQFASWLLARPWRLIPAWAERRGQRRALAELANAPHLLDDIGLTRARALSEANKPFWKR